MTKFRTVMALVVATAAMPAMAQTAKTTAKPAPAAKAAATPSAAQLAARTRQKQCAANYQTDKAAKKIPAGQGWPQYYSACSKKLKG